MAILPGSRLRQNGIFGTVTDNPLTIGATSFSSAGLTSLGVVSGNHAIATLDPLKVYGNPEIIMITAHTGSSTVSTIQRGMFGTSAREHPSGTLWVHAAIDDDFIKIVTSSTRPSDQYEGQLIYETDTNKLVGFGGVSWAPRDAGGTIGLTAHTADTAVTNGYTDIVSVTVTTIAGRRYKVTGHVNGSLDTADHWLFTKLMEGATQFGYDSLSSAGPWSDAQGALHMEAIVAPSAGSHTYKIQAVATLNGIATIIDSTGGPGFIIVEDIGAA